MDHFFIITNTVKDPTLSVSRKICRYLEDKGRHCTVHRADSRIGDSCHYTDPGLIPKETECIIVLGGDGTVLQAARDILRTGIPLLGINLGTLGYLAEVDKGQLYQALDQLISGSFEIEERMMLRGRVYREDRLIGEDYALNDIVIGRNGALRVIRFMNYVNQYFLNSFDADGIILSTPTGSTGYSLSAGGPIVSPNASLIIMTPIAPHTLNTRSIILPPTDTVTVEIGEGRKTKMERGLASFDGNAQIEMITGDRIVIEKAETCTRIVKLSNRSFVEVLRQKMNEN